MNFKNRLINNGIFSILIYPLCFFLILTSCHSKQKNTNKEDDSITKVEFKQLFFNFGDITEGETVTHSFYFKNIGEHNFVVRNIDSGCGCTTVDYDKTPVRPGKEGKFEIAFNSSGRYGKQYKEIRIFANVPEKAVTLKFSANVNPN